MQPNLRVITQGLRFPEGPIAMNDGSVVLVEIEGGRLPEDAPLLDAADAIAVDSQNAALGDLRGMLAQAVADPSLQEQLAAEFGDLL
jgi:hypothetical protein